MGSGSLAAMAVFESKYKKDLEVYFCFFLLYFYYYYYYYYYWWWWWW